METKLLCIDCGKRPPAPQSLCCAECLNAWRDVFYTQHRNDIDPADALRDHLRDAGA